MEEIWKDIKNYEELYQVSNLGRVKSLLTNKNLKPLNNFGYKRVTLYKNGTRKIFSVHRLVAQTFIPNPHNKLEINHKDGNKSNNCIDNLEWVTRSENQLHAYNTGLQKCKKVIQYDKENNIINIFKNLKEANKITGITHLSECCNNKRKSSGGYYWKFENL